MNYDETIAFLFDTLPMFQRIGDAAIKKDLTNIRLLCALFDQPHLEYPCIHIAGTNGKGSTSHMLASVFQAAGKKVGLYTSPHYVDFRERIKINGKKMEKEEVVSFVHAWRKKWEPIQPSFFEITLVMAFDYFRSQKIDIAIIETGLGGRLDSTNIITPLLSVITNIGYDHMQILGNTLPEIAFEKAGIIKPGIPVVIGEWHSETAVVFRNKAGKENAPISFASRHLVVEKRKGNIFKHFYHARTRSLPWIGSFETDLTGPYQKKNIRTVLEAIWRWNHHYSDQALSELQVKNGLKDVKTSTSMIGRWMIIQDHPLVITDAAHNVDGIQAILPDLLNIKASQRHFVLGFVSDKNVKKILSLFPGDGHYYWCSPDIPRGKPASETMEAGNDLRLKGKSYASVIEAYQEALNQAVTEDLIFVGGSSYVVGDFLGGMKKE